MTKKTKVTIALILASIAVFVIMITFMPEKSFEEKQTAVVTIENGKASPEYHRTVVEIKESGMYVLNPDWSENEQPGFVTGFSVTDESGKLIYSTVGGLLKLDTAPIELAEGKYICRFDYICSYDALSSYMKDYSVPGTFQGGPEWFKDGTWKMAYTLKVFSDSGYGDMLIIACGAVLGILLAALIVTLSRDQNSHAFKYDERQIAEQGKSYKFAFFTFLACAGIVMVISDVLTKYVEMRLLIFIIMIISAGAMLTHSVMHDAYFRVDESRRFYVFFFLFFAVFNIGIGIIHFMHDEVFVDGVLSFLGTANLLCGILSGYLLILILIKKLRDREED